MKAERAYPSVAVTPKAEAAILRGHPWIYDAEILSMEGTLENGGLVDVRSRKGAYLGTGFLSEKSKIRIRLISRNANDRFDAAFWERKLRWAWESAVVDGKCVDTTMGLGPLAGFPMGTRSGDVDATILEYLMGRYGYDIKEMLNILNKKSGVLGISGVSSDFRDLDEAAAQGNERAALALEKFIYEVKKFIGAYATAMGGVDAIVFTAGIGENSKELRAEICQGMEYMGVKMDMEKNNVRGQEVDVSAAGSKVKIFIIPTNEELMIAMDTAALCAK